jgi:hypothetical protein
VSVLILDHFGGSGTLSGRTPDTTNTPGNTWGVEAGVTGTVGSGVLTLSATGDANVSIETGVANMEVTCTLNLGGFGWSCGVGFNYTDVNGSPTLITRVPVLSCTPSLVGPLPILRRELP